uniref:Uncharacterized protein LOC114338426 isoform X3 n=1 Tax=Diabrotica virgifera virgifera TaxID=50390 RepID=A0A6P7GM34_DIAVI
MNHIKTKTRKFFPIIIYRSPKIDVPKFYHEKNNRSRVKNVVLVLVYLTLTMMNSASTAPAPKDDKWWESPCGSSPEPAEPLSTTPPQEFNKWHLSDLLIQAQYNLIQANHLKDSFIFSTVTEGFGRPAITTGEPEYPWLTKSLNIREIQAIHTGKEIMRDLFRSAQAIGYALHIIKDFLGYDRDAAKLKDDLDYVRNLHKSLLTDMCEYMDEREMEPYPYEQIIEPLGMHKNHFQKHTWARNVIANCVEFYLFLWEYLNYHQKTCWEVHRAEKRSNIPEEDFEDDITQKVKKLQSI